MKYPEIGYINEFCGILPQTTPDMAHLIPDQFLPTTQNFDGLDKVDVLLRCVYSYAKYRVRVINYNKVKFGSLASIKCSKKLNYTQVRDYDTYVTDDTAVHFSPNYHAYIDPDRANFVVEKGPLIQLLETFKYLNTVCATSPFTYTIDMESALVSSHGMKTRRRTIKNTKLVLPRPPSTSRPPKRNHREVTYCVDGIEKTVRTSRLPPPKRFKPNQ